MSEFFRALTEHPLTLNALLAGLLASVACGVVGTYVVIRRITYLAGGIAHCVLGGIGAAVYLREVHGVAWATPLVGAVASALLAAMAIGLVSLRLKQREDTVISAMWAVGMAAGVLFIVHTPGYRQDLMGYLFGDIQMVSAGSLWMVAALDAVAVAFSLTMHRQMLVICFDDIYARSRGLRVDVYYLLLLCITALTVVLLVMVVGIVMVIALLTLPAATAGLLARRVWQMQLLAVLLCMLLTTAGQAISYSPDLPTGATTIVLAGGVYLLAVVAKAALRRRRRPNPAV